MAISLTAPRATELKPRIVVFGVGGAGGNAVNNMIEAGLEGVEFVVANTDAQQLQFAKTDRRIQLGANITQGLGAGAHPDVGGQAAEESINEISEHLEGAHMVFITAGMGGGTGTGAAPIIAAAARERGILTVGVVTKPFTFEGRHRMRLAEAGVNELQRNVDTLIIIPNQNLFRIANERTTFAEAFGMADQVLHSGVRSITDLMVLPGLINLDFADVRAVMSEMGKAMMGTGEAAGDDRALMAAQNAIANPLLDEVSLKGAKAVLINVTGGLDMTLLEVDEAANAISSEVDADANIIFGAAFDPSLDGKVRVSVVATGMDSGAMIQQEPVRQTPRRIEPAFTPAVNPASRAGMTAFGRPSPTPMAPSPQVSWPEPARYEAPTVVHAPEPEPVVQPESAPVMEAPQAAPVVASAPAPAQTSAPAPTPIRIVDPAVSEEPTGGDLYLKKPEPASQARSYARQPTPETRRPAAAAPTPEPQADAKKGGFFSMFGGRRYEEPAKTTAPASPRAVVGGPGPTAAPARAPEPSESADDLDIPSFLRRLAN